MRRPRFGRVESNDGVLVRFKIGCRARGSIGTKPPTLPGLRTFVRSISTDEESSKNRGRRFSYREKGPGFMQSAKSHCGLLLEHWRNADLSVQIRPSFSKPLSSGQFRVADHVRQIVGTPDCKDSQRADAEQSRYSLRMTAVTSRRLVRLASRL